MLDRSRTLPTLLFGAAVIGALSAAGQLPPRSAIAFVSTRHAAVDPVTTGVEQALSAGEIYLMDPDGANARRLTRNAFFDCFPSISPDGRRIVFESNRRRKEPEPFNTFDLFVMKVDGSDEKPLVRGASATWSPDSRSIAFHASASVAAGPINTLPGAATSDSDIFVLKVDDFLARGGEPTNVTRNPAAVDDDPDWSPDGRRIAFTSHAVTDTAEDHTTAEIYVVDPSGKGKPVRLTSNTEEERAPAWSPDGRRILFSCRKGPPREGAPPTFELCTMNADGTNVTRLTNNTVPELTPSWSHDGSKILFHRAIGGRGRFQLFVINADGSGERQLTTAPGLNGFARWGAAPHN